MHNTQYKAPTLKLFIAIISLSVFNIPAYAKDLRENAYTDISPNIAVVTEDPAVFIPQTYSANTSALNLQSLGYAYQRRFNLNDPAERIETRLLDFMTLTYGLTLHSQPLDFANQKKRNGPKILENTLLLDVDTQKWGLESVYMSYSRTKLKYSATMELLDGSTGKLVLKEKCKFKSRRSKEAHTLVELEKDEGRLMHELVDKLIKTCTRKFIEQIEKED